MADARASLEEDFAESRCVLVDVPWRATLERAVGISRAHSARLVWSPVAGESCPVELAELRKLQPLSAGRDPASSR